MVIRPKPICHKPLPKINSAHSLNHIHLLPKSLPSTHLFIYLNLNPSIIFTLFFIIITNLSLLSFHFAFHHKNHHSPSLFRPTHHHPLFPAPLKSLFFLNISCLLLILFVFLGFQRWFPVTLAPKTHTISGFSTGEDSLSIPLFCFLGELSE